jgi:serine/threonine protein phosphatase PrpC
LKKGGSHLDSYLGVAQTPGDREYQEDDYGVIDGSSSSSDAGNQIVLVLADGMGGHAGGDVASRTIVRGFIEVYQDKAATSAIGRALEEALHSANQALARVKEDDSTLEGMGSTLVAIACEKEQVVWISVGDSPLWLYVEGSLKRLNQDHSVGAVLRDLVELGKLTQAEADADRGKSALRSAIDGDEIELIDGPTSASLRSPDDLILLASDGIQSLSDDEIGTILNDNRGRSAQAIADLLMTAVLAKEVPGQDNTTILVLDARALGGPIGPSAESERAEMQCSTARATSHSSDRTASGKSSKAGSRAAAIIFAAVVLALALVWFFPGSAPPPEKPPEPVDVGLDTIEEEG